MKGARDASRCGRSEIEEWSEGEEEKGVGREAKVVTCGSAALGMVETAAQSVAAQGC